MKQDILQPVPMEEMMDLRDLFKIEWPSHVHIYNFLDTCIRWKSDKKSHDYVSLFCPNGDWSDGTIVAILELYCYDIIAYSLDSTLTRLQHALKQTKLIDWSKEITFPSLCSAYTPPVIRLRKELVGHAFAAEVDSYLWWISKEKALHYHWSVPNGYYIGALKVSDADVMNTAWPYRYEGSEKYIAKLIQFNGGVGLYAKEDGELCAWVLKSYFGALAILQVADKHKRKGFGTLVTKIFSKKLAEDDLDAIGCVVVKNINSRNMFQKLGFEKIVAVTCLLDFEC